MISFIIPCIQTNWFAQSGVVQELKYTVLLKPVIILANPQASHQSLTLSQWAGFLYIAGIAIFSIGLIARLLAVKRFIKIPEGTASYSFFKRIYLGDGQVSNKAISAHESIHARPMAFGRYIVCGDRAYPELGLTRRCIFQEGTEKCARIYCRRKAQLNSQRAKKNMRCSYLVKRLKHQ